MDSSQGPILSESSRRPPNYSRLAWGLVLVILGCLLLVGRFQLMEVDNWLRWTPLVVVGIGLFSLAQAGSPGQVRSGLWMIGIGVWLLVSLFHFYGLSFNNSWPFLAALRRSGDPPGPGTQGDTLGRRVAHRYRPLALRQRLRLAGAEVEHVVARIGDSQRHPAGDARSGTSPAPFWPLGLRARGGVVVNQLRDSKSYSFSRLFAGVLVIAVGLIFLLENLQLLEAAKALRFWPVALIVIGTAKIFDARGSRGFGVVLAAVGTWLLLENFGLVTLSFAQLWPVVLIAVGGLLIRRAFLAPWAGPAGRSRAPSRGLPAFSPGIG